MKPLIFLGLTCTMAACFGKESSTAHKEAESKPTTETASKQETTKKQSGKRGLVDSNPDAGEGAKAKRQEGMVPKKRTTSRFSGSNRGQTYIDFEAADISVADTLIGGSIGIGSLGTKGGSISYSMMPERIEHEPSYNTETYTDYGVNDFVSTSKDAHSTFSIDVDTASFAIARKKLLSGSMPPLASVRTEEFINYFSYGYKTPNKKDIFTIDMKAFSDPIRTDRTYLRVGLKAKEYTKSTRPALNLNFLVDVSGSMSDPDKLPLAQKAMSMLVESFRPDDVISISTYAGRVAQILPATSGNNKEAIKRAIQSMESGGSTAMSSGIDMAYEQAWAQFDPQKENRVVILSDGDANVGNLSHTQLIEQIKSYADRGITLSTIGFGMGNYKDTIMEQLANKGDGNSYYIDSRKEARKVFVEGFNSTMISVARDVKIQVEFDPKIVSSYRLIGYENRDIADKDFRNDKVDAGEVGAGHSITALYEIKTTGKQGALATTRLRYEKPGKDNTATERVYQLSSSKILSNPTKDLQLAYTAATFAEVLRKSPYAHGITIEQLHTHAKEHALNEDIQKVLRAAHKMSYSTSVK